MLAFIELFNKILSLFVKTPEEKMMARVFDRAAGIQSDAIQINDAIKRGRTGSTSAIERLFSL